MQRRLSYGTQVGQMSKRVWCPGSKSIYGQPHAVEAQLWQTGTTNKQQVFMSRLWSAPTAQCR